MTDMRPRAADAADIRTAAAAYAQAKDELVVAEREYAKAMALVIAGAKPELLDQARADKDLAESKLRTAHRQQTTAIDSQSSPRAFV